MTFIDWSDSEGIFGLLIEYVADEQLAENQDKERRKFLSELLQKLRRLNDGLDANSNVQIVDHLQAICSSLDPDFKEDPVVLHVADCIEQLGEINRRER